MSDRTIKLEGERRTYVRMIGKIRDELNRALSEEQSRRGLSKADLARAMGRDRAFVTRKLAGSSNMTLETLAAIAHALGRRVDVSVPSPERALGSNARPANGPSTDPFGGQLVVVQASGEHSPAPLPPTVVTSGSAMALES